MSVNLLNRYPTNGILRRDRVAVESCDGRFNLLMGDNTLSQKEGAGVHVQLPLLATPTFGGGGNYTIASGDELLGAYWRVPDLKTTLTLPSAASAVAALKFMLGYMPLPGATFSIVVDNTDNTLDVVLTPGAGSWTVTAGTVAAGDVAQFTVIVTNPTLASEALVVIRSSSGTGALPAPDYAGFSALMPADNANPITPGDFIEFPTLDVASAVCSITAISSTVFQIAKPGDYRITWRFPTDAPGQSIIFFNGGTTTDSCTGSNAFDSQQSNTYILRTGVANGLLSIQNPAASGNTYSLPTFAGSTGAVPVAATLLIERVG